ncbi:MAG: MarR family transcriptional regulator [Sediminimonas qiaohouensis]|uniref:MarR family transcriptional regulator n=1 Tax=Sediminimonas qiaohouensis TaxID=552061 RepID=A0A7C9L692_9RHOB|nr:MarR family transcriptional regulator [Sediminimonas qiaohouensis]MTJ03115.1 MarR family transcriptional regulator [Sediminimonas qiaohouensis]
MTEQTAPLTRRRLRTWLRILRLTRGAENHLREFLRAECDTTLPRFDVMAALYRADKPMKMSELSQKLLVSNGNATAVVDRLEQDGLAIRVASETDRRVKHVTLSDAGRDRFAVLARAHEAEVDKLFANLGHDELDMMRTIIRRMEGSSQ